MCDLISVFFAVDNKLIWLFLFCSFVRMHFGLSKNQFITWISIKSILDALRKLSASKGSSKWIDFFYHVIGGTQVPQYTILIVNKRMREKKKSESNGRGGRVMNEYTWIFEWWWNTWKINFIGIENTNEEKKCGEEKTKDEESFDSRREFRSRLFQWYVKRNSLTNYTPLTHGSKKKDALRVLHDIYL